MTNFFCVISGWLKNQNDQFWGKILARISQSKTRDINFPEILCKFKFFIYRF